jgi:cyanobactin maturation PatA/PatG family protease
VTAIQWILVIDETPIYAIAPMGAFAFDIHDTLVEFLQDTYKDGAERISVPGIIVGKTMLFNGETVPVIQPDQRGMFSWKKSLLVDHAAKAGDASRSATEALDDFLTRVYDQTRNLGISSAERALNFAATDALMLQFIFKQVDASPKFKNMELDTFTVTKSPVCRPDFECWDVTLIFYDPNNLQRARRAKQFTVDVSDVMPTMLTVPPREFSLR